jgi:hypothetical protein
MRPSYAERVGSLTTLPVTGPEHRNPSTTMQSWSVQRFSEVEQLTPDLTGAHAQRHPPDLSGRLAITLGGRLLAVAHAPLAPEEKPSEPLIGAFVKRILYGTAQVGTLLVGHG